MSYTPNVWANGDVVTSAKLNAMEQGIAAASGGGGGVLVVNATVSGSTGTLNKTAGEIYSVLEGGGIVACKFELVADEIVLWFLDTYYTFDEQYGYQFVFRHGSDTVEFTAVTANDYPTAEHN